MKLAICSDLHLEFGNLVLTNDENADVLVLAGDICVARDFKYLKLDQSIKANRKLARDANLFIDFFRNVSEQFPQVIYVAGNHEHYTGDFTLTHSYIREALAPFSNIHFLEKDMVVIDGVAFIGATLWTNLNKRDPLACMSITSEVNDYNAIKNSNRKFGYKVLKLAPINTLEDFDRALESIEQLIEIPAEKVVVVTHHAPCSLSIDPKYVNKVVANYAYYSDLSELILDNPKIKIWFHGHIHRVIDYTLGDTRVLANPRGYVGSEAIADQFVLRYVDLPDF